jgi:structure-specific endonuclease subunit SLX1
MVPRGGHCKSCKEYILWGDVIRGCYRRSRKQKQPANSIFTTEGENLDFVESSGIEDNATSMKRKRGRPRKDLAILSSGASSSVSSSRPLKASRKIRQLPSKGSRKQKQPTNSIFTTEGENLDFVASSGIEDNATSMKRKPGRPRKDLAILSPGASSSVSSSRPLKVSRKQKKSASPPKLKLSSKGKGNQSPAPSQPAKARIRKK